MTCVTRDEMGYSTYTESHMILPSAQCAMYLVLHTFYFLSFTGYSVIYVNCSQSLFYFVHQENLTSWFSLPNVTGDEILFITVKIKREDNLIEELRDS